MCFEDFEVIVVGNGGVGDQCADKREYPIITQVYDAYQHVKCKYGQKAFGIFTFYHQEIFDVNTIANDPHQCETIDDEGPQIGGEQSKRIVRSEEHTSELQSRENLVCRLL